MTLEKADMCVGEHHTSSSVTQGTYTSGGTLISPLPECHSSPLHCAQGWSRQQEGIFLKLLLPDHVTASVHLLLVPTLAACLDTDPDRYST